MGSAQLDDKSIADFCEALTSTTFKDDEEHDHDEDEDHEGDQDHASLAAIVRINTIQDQCQGIRGFEQDGVSGILLATRSPLARIHPISFTPK